MFVIVIKNVLADFTVLLAKLGRLIGNWRQEPESIKLGSKDTRNG